MARRNGKKGDYLMTSDYDGRSYYASELQKDYWGDYGKKVLKRNLQEIAKPLNDPEPVRVFRGPQYEYVVPCTFETQPIFIGTTNIRTPDNSPAAQALDLNPAIPDMSVGCTLVVR